MPASSLAIQIQPSQNTPLRRSVHSVKPEFNPQIDVKVVSPDSQSLEQQPKPSIEEREVVVPKKETEIKSAFEPQLIINSLPKKHLSPVFAPHRRRFRYRSPNNYPTQYKLTQPSQDADSTDSELGLTNSRNLQFAVMSHPSRNKVPVKPTLYTQHLFHDKSVRGSDMTKTRFLPSVVKNCGEHIDNMSVVRSSLQYFSQSPSSSLQQASATRYVSNYHVPPKASPGPIPKHSLQTSRSKEQWIDAH